MSRPRSVILVVVVWSVIYLPRLGTLELKSEEGRRVLPAVSMLQTGNFLVPQVGSEPYFRKPPLINWLVAASFKIFHAQNEWTARLPSVFCLLVVALAFIYVARDSLGGNGAIVAALIWLTNFGLLEKGRMIEIEALYVSLTALAFICWLSWWDQPRRQWLAWTLPWILLGLGLLAKGPLNLFFFYAVVVAILWQDREWKRLTSLPHIVGVLLMLGIFLAWAIPCLARTQPNHVATVWSQQLSGRLTTSDFKFRDWLLNIPRGLAYLLPWIVLLPFARPQLLPNESQRKLVRGLSLGVLPSFLIVNLLPSALPRYTMPLLAPAIWLLAIFISEHALIWPKRIRQTITWTIVAIVAAMLIYSIAIIPQLERREKIRPIAAQLEAAIPPNESLYAVDPDYQPALFYLHRPIIYVNLLAELPANARYILVRPPNELPVEKLTAEPILRLQDYRNSRLILLRVGPAPN